MSDTSLDPMAIWHPTPENIAKLPGCVRKAARKAKSGRPDVEHILARRNWIWRWQAAVRDLENLEKAAARADADYRQATLDGDHAAAELLGLASDSLHRAEDAVLQIPAPDIAGLERKIAIVQRREAEECPVACGVLISILSGDGVRLAKGAA